LRTGLKVTVKLSRVLLIASVLGCVEQVPVPAGDGAELQALQVPSAELSLASEPSRLLDSAEALIRRDSSVGMVTVDADGRPRIRTVRAFRLENPKSDRERFTIYVLTRRSTRKVEQLGANDAVTLYFNQDERTSYATLMGQATVHRDPSVPRLRAFWDEGTKAFFWPAFPEDFIIIEVVPQWLEFIGPGLWNDPNTWRPQAVIF
jgi:general stress protein 26